MVLRTNLVQKRNEVDPHSPSYCLPVQANSPKFGGLGTLIAIGCNRPNSDDTSVHERENEVSRCYLSHEFIKGVSCSVGIALRRPEITTFDLLPICLVLIYPTSSARRFNPFGLISNSRRTRPRKRSKSPPTSQEQTSSDKGKYVHDNADAHARQKRRGVRSFACI